MYWYLTAVSVLLLLAAAASTIFALFAWKRRPVPGSVAFSVFMLAVTLWSLTYLLQITSPHLSTKEIWFTWQYLCVGILPVAWLVFSLRYTNRQDWLTPRHLLLLMLFPFTVLLLALTNDFHRLLWEELSILNGTRLPLLTITPGIWYWAVLFGLYSAFLLGSLLLVTSTRYEIASLAPHQALLLLAGLALPWFGGALYLTGLSFINLTALTFALCGIIVGKYALGFQLVKRTPLANQFALSNLNDGVLIVDTDLVIVDANPAMASISKRPLRSLLGCKLSDLFPELAEKHQALQQKPVDIHCGDSSSAPYYEVQLTPILDWRKMVSSEMLIFHDISERKRREAMHNEITHSMVHDLRSPVSNSLFALELLKKEPAIEDTNSEHLIDLLQENTEKVLALINNILDVNRFENSKIPIRPTAVSLPKLVDRVLKSQSPRAVMQNVALIRDLPTDLPPAWADEALLERVLQNLVDNSLKFSPNGSAIRITAVLQNPHNPDQRKMLVSVTDEGPGLPPELANTVFEKFVTGTGKRSGNGLGLAFCQMALAAHNQKIWISEPGTCGATITFSLALPPQLPEDILIEDKWPNTNPTASESPVLISQMSPNW